MLRKTGKLLQIKVETNCHPPTYHPYFLFLSVFLSVSLTQTHTYILYLVIQACSGLHQLLSIRMFSFFPPACPQIPSNFLHQCIKSHSCLSLYNINTHLDSQSNTVTSLMVQNIKFWSVPFISLVELYNSWAKLALQIVRVNSLSIFWASVAISKSCRFQHQIYFTT